MDIQKRVKYTERGISKGNQSEQNVLQPKAIPKNRHHGIPTVNSPVILPWTVKMPINSLKS